MCAIQEVMEILTKDVEFKKRGNAHRQHAEKARNVVKVSMFWNVSAHLVSMEIRILVATISTNVHLHLKFVVKMQFASTHREATTADVDRIMREIHSKCVLPLNEVSVPIHRTVNAVKTFNAHLVSNAIEETAKISARRSNVVHELLAILELVFVHLVTREIQPISRKVAR